MPSQPLTTRVPPGVHDRLREMSVRRGTSLAATAADLLSAAVAEGSEGAVPQPDGTLVGAVRSLLADVTAPQAVVHRELAVRPARTVERGERGAVAAADLMTDVVDKALRAQHQEDNPNAGDSLDSILSSLQF
ncbi:hypothetical protein ACIRP2_05655 [Streptomyces sp. NPDC101194]|uniref:hypothetical protein n=1 Tax=Streptomyces sp. NPDC101194 TaxID=3366127 RepID=UPI00380464EE